MKPRHLWTALAIGLSASAALLAQSVVLLVPPDQTRYGISDPDFGRVFAEDFVLSSTLEITEIVVWGVGSESGGDDSFSILFHRDDMSLPGQVVGSAFNMVPTHRSATGQSVGTRVEFVYYLHLPSPVTLEHGIWWVEIYNSTPGPGSWGWAGGHPDPVHGRPGAAIASEVPGALWSQNAFDFSITIVGAPPRIFGDGFEVRNTSSWNVTVPSSGVPVADFIWSAVGLMVTFLNNSSGAEPLSYSWNFGDGNTSTQVNPVHTYALDGTYQVTLTVSNALGVDSIAQSVTVSP